MRGRRLLAQCYDVRNLLFDVLRSAEEVERSGLQCLGALQISGRSWKRWRQALKALP